METKIIIVDDDESNLRILTAVVQKRGFEVLPTSRPLEGIALALRPSQTAPVMILDVFMPGMSGIEVARRVAAKHATSRFLFVSGTPIDALPELERLGLKELMPGSSFYLSKPFTAQTLLTCLLCLLGEASPPPRCPHYLRAARIPLD